MCTLPLFIRVYFMDIKDRFVPNIYEFCDRWCEQCKKSHLCMNFFLMERMKEKADIVAKEVGKKKPEEDGWDHLRKMLGVAYRVLKDVVNENGLKMEDICGFDHLKKGLMAGGNEEKLEEEERVEKLIRTSDALNLSLVYEKLGDKCLQRVLEVEEGIDPDESPVCLDVETVTWYVELVHLKMWKALYGLYSDDEEAKKSNYNGYVKVALLAIRSSLKSWKTLARQYPVLKEHVLPLIVLLYEVEKAIVREFPDGWSFKRPGLDDDEVATEAATVLPPQ